MNELNILGCYIRGWTQRLGKTSAYRVWPFGGCLLGKSRKWKDEGS